MKNFNIKFSTFFLNFCCNLPLILSIFTQSLFAIISLSVNYYSNPLLVSSITLITWLFVNFSFFFVWGFLIIFLASLLFLFDLKNIIFFFFSVITLFFTIIGTASADDLIAAVDSSEKIIPFSQTFDASLNENISEYNASINKHELNNILGKNVNNLHPSYSFLHQVSAASSVNLPAVVFAPTASFIKHEVAYISENPLTKIEIETLLLKFNSPIISKNGNVWIVTILTPDGSKSNKLDSNNQNALNNYLTSSDFFPKSGFNLRALRLGDITGFNSINLNVVYSAEFKTKQKEIDQDTINLNDFFNTRFQKSALVDKQLLDSINKMLYYRVCGSSEIESLELKNLSINDADLTKKFTLGHKLATNIHNQPRLKFNLVSYTLNNISKIIK